MPDAAEVLRIIAEAALVLISVTIPTYAISASFLGKETVRTMSRIKMQRENTERRVHLEAKNIEQMQAEIRAYELEEETLKGRLKRISVLGVIVYPAIFYGLALVIASSGLYHYPTPIRISLSTGTTEIPTLGLCLVTLLIGSYFLGRALLTIDTVAREAEFAPPTGSVEIKVASSVSERMTSAHYFVSTAAKIERVVVDWQRRVAYYCDSRVDKAVGEGRIPAFALPTLDQDSRTNKEKLALVPRGPTPEELPL